MRRVLIAKQPPFSLAAVLRSHGWIDLPSFGTDEVTGETTYISRLDSGRVVDLRFSAVPNGVSLRVDGSLDEGERRDAVRQVRLMLGLDEDLLPFYALARRDHRLAYVEREKKGRLLRSPTLFEDTVKTILTTNTTWKGTIRMVGALVEQFGEPLPDDSTRRAFPSPACLAEVRVGTLRGETRLGYRAPYVRVLAERVAHGDLDLEALCRATEQDLPSADLRQQLLEITGVGPYAAAHLLMLLGRYEYLPVDSWARKLVSNAWHNGEAVGAAEVEAAFADWGRWKALAYWFWDWDAG